MFWDIVENCDDDFRDRQKSDLGDLIRYMHLLI